MEPKISKDLAKKQLTAEKKNVNPETKNNLDSSRGDEKPARSYKENDRGDEENASSDLKNSSCDAENASNNEVNGRDDEENAQSVEKNYGSDEENVQSDEKNSRGDGENSSCDEENAGNDEENVRNVEEKAWSDLENPRGDEESSNCHAENFSGGEESAQSNEENACNVEENVQRIEENARRIEEHASSDEETQNCDKYWGWNMDWQTIQVEMDQQSIRLVKEYRMAIREHLHKLEVLSKPNPKYMRKQKEITNKMRSILIDWLVAVNEEYDMWPETLHLSVAYIDKYLSTVSVPKDVFQLVGVAAMMIASKVEQIYRPDPLEYAYLTRDTFNAEQVMGMEMEIFRAIGYNAHLPTPCFFIQDYCTACNFHKRVVYLAMYIVELSLVEGRNFLEHQPSEIAASSVAIARHTLKENVVWPRSVEVHSGYSLKRLSSIILHLYRLYENSDRSSLSAVNKKYSKRKYLTVSLYPQRMLDNNLIPKL